LGCVANGNSNTFHQWFEDGKTGIDAVGYAKAMSIGSGVIRDHGHGRGRVVVPDLRL
jgi:hypothetical protein